MYKSFRNRSLSWKYQIISITYNCQYIIITFLLLIFDNIIPYHFFQIFWLMVEINLHMYGSFVWKWNILPWEWSFLIYFLDQTFYFVTIEILPIQHDLGCSLYKLGCKPKFLCFILRIHNNTLVWWI